MFLPPTEPAFYYLSSVIAVQPKIKISFPKNLGSKIISFPKNLGSKKFLFQKSWE